MKNNSVNGDGVREVEGSGGIDVDWNADARVGMINAVKAATDAGAFPKVLVTIAPPSDGSVGSEVRALFDPEQGRDHILQILRRAIAVVIDEEVAPKVGALAEEKLSQVQDWTRVIVDLVEAGKTPHAIVAVGPDETSVEVVTSFAIEDIPAFLRDAAIAMDEPDGTTCMDCSSH